jgi:hypothetical protein
MTGPYGGPSWRCSTPTPGFSAAASASTGSDRVTPTAFSSAFGGRPTATAGAPACCDPSTAWQAALVWPPRTWYQQQIRQRDHQGWDESALAELDAGFNRFAAAGEPFADSARVQQDIAALEAVVARVNAYTSKTIAHRDASLLRGVPAPAVTWAELDDALDAVGNIHRKYYRLCHPGESLGGLTPLISPGWIQMFETAWMPPGFTMPDHFDFDPAWTND